VKTWEYATVKFDGLNGHLNGGPNPLDTLNGLGERGWELVGVVGPSDRASVNSVAYFKRPKVTVR